MAEKANTFGFICLALTEERKEPTLADIRCKLSEFDIPFEDWPSLLLETELILNVDEVSKYSFI